MAFNKENYKKIREEYNAKYLKAQADAEARRAEAESNIDGLAELNRQLGGLGLELMQAAISGEEQYKEELAGIRHKNQELLELRGKLLEINGYPKDYLEIRYECEKCGDTGFVDCRMCECMRKKMILAGLESSGLSNILEKQTFDNFSLEYYKNNISHYNMMKANVEELKKYAEDFGNDTVGGKTQNILLIGGTGLGKTHLSSAVAHRVIERGFDVKYTTAVGLLADFEYQRFGNSVSGRDGGDVSAYYDCDLLIIDDLGTEVVNQFTVSCLYNIINIRLNNSKATIISTNLTQNELREKYWDRITSRMFGEYRPLLFVGTDVRALKLKNKRR